MIREISIQNLALIESMSLDFFSGFTVVTGETGAGKSILIGAIGLLLGDRASSENIRNGSEEAVITGVFEFDPVPAELQSMCRELAIDISENQLVIRRRISRTDRSRIYLNETPVSLGILRKVGNLLVDIHGQHEHQSLLHEEIHRDIIDRLDEVKSMRIEYEDAYTHYREIVREGERHIENTRLLSEKREILDFQLDELKNARLKTGEEEELERELGMLSSSAQRITSINAVLEMLSSSSVPSIDKQIASVIKSLEQLSKYDSSANPWIGDVESALRIFSELETFCGTYLDKIGSVNDPGRIEKINARLAKIQRLKKKYGMTVDELIVKMEGIKKELLVLENSDSDRREIDKKILETKRRCIDTGKKLGTLRRHAAATFDASITALIRGLGFNGGNWKTLFEPLDEPSPYGLETIRFFVRTNPGENELPLSSTASGGEISRLMLAVKSVVAENDNVPVLIFDEIDTGIGGTIAGYVGKLLKKLSVSHQVLCISHLHQIASLADHHLRVYKELSGTRTITRIKGLSREERIAEIARMLGGDSSISLQHARELLGSTT